MPRFPKVSIIIPTFNSARTLKQCLESIRGQDYPRSRYEIVAADAGSTDGTLEILRAFRVRVFPNPLRTGEAGKLVGLRHARFGIVGLVDSDNVLIGRDFLRRVLEPFSDPEIVGSEPRRFTWDPGDTPLNRYCALMGVNDPLCYSLGVYDRENVVSGDWTGLRVRREERGTWQKAWFTPDANPTVGANAFFIRTRDLRSAVKGDYLFDIDAVSLLIARGRNAYAMVDAGVLHLYGRGLGDFLRKQKRRVQDYLHYRGRGERHYPWGRVPWYRWAAFGIATVLIVPHLVTSIRGYLRRRDPALFLHPLLSGVTLLLYGIQRIAGLFATGIASRDGWQKR